MEITAAEPRRKGFFQLYIDGEPAVKIDMQVFLTSSYKVGSEIDDDELYELIQTSEKRRASEKALYLLEHRSHSKKELQDKIKRSGISADIAKAAAEHMEDIGLVNDGDYARNFARTLIYRKKFAKNRIKQELKQKGISDDIIEELMSELEGTEELSSPSAVVRDILIRKYPKFAEDEKIKRRAVSAMMRLGYSYDDIRAAMQEDYDDYIE